MIIMAQGRRRLHDFGFRPSGSGIGTAKFSLHGASGAIYGKRMLGGGDQARPSVSSCPAMAFSGRDAPAAPEEKLSFAQRINQGV